MVRPSDRVRDYLSIAAGKGSGRGCRGGGRATRRHLEERRLSTPAIDFLLAAEDMPTPLHSATRWPPRPRAREGNLRGLPTHGRPPAGTGREVRRRLANPRPAPGRRNRVDGEYDLIVQQVEAGQVDGLVARIIAMKSPSTSGAKLSIIGVAAALLGRLFDGHFAGVPDEGGLSSE